MMNRRMRMAGICAAVAMGGSGLSAAPERRRLRPPIRPVQQAETHERLGVGERDLFDREPGCGRRRERCRAPERFHRRRKLDSEAFQLPPGDAPASNLYVNTYTVDNTVGFLFISTSGAVYPVGSDVSGYTRLAGSRSRRPDRALTTVPGARERMGLGRSDLRHGQSGRGHRLRGHRPPERLLGERHRRRHRLRAAHRRPAPV